MMKINKQDIKCLVAFIIILAITRHIVHITSEKLIEKNKKSILELIKSTNYQNIISSGDIIAAFVFCYLIRKCCGSNLVKNGITAFLMFYLFASYQISAAVSMGNGPSYTAIFDIESQKNMLKLTVAPTIAAMIVCRCC